VSLALVLLLTAGPVLAHPQAPPDTRARKALVAEFFTLDGRSEAGQARQAEIVKILDALPLERLSDRKKAVKELLAAADKRREMMKESGSYFWWEQEKRGLYILGGETRKPSGLLIGMHGGGVGSGDAASAADGLQQAAKDLGWLAIFPEVLEKTEHGWTDSGTEEWVLDLMECALRTWDLDPDHVYFSGHSMGGYGTWTLGAHHADRVAGLAASAGAPTPLMGPDGKIVELAKGVIPNLRNVPLVVYQSLDDPNVPPDANQAAAQAVAKARDAYGGYEQFEYWEVNGRGHDYPPGGMAALLAKIAERKRNVTPAKLVWQPALAWKRRFYWLHWPTPRLNAIVIAEADRAANRMRLNSRADLSGLEILLDERLVDLTKEVVIEVNGKEAWRGVPAVTWGSLLLTAAEGDARLIFPARVALP
jgi:poly(3-hydroxybutyrate) depolymerase